MLSYELPNLKYKTIKNIDKRGHLFNYYFVKHPYQVMLYCPKPLGSGCAELYQRWTGKVSPLGSRNPMKLERGREANGGPKASDSLISNETRVGAFFYFLGLK